MFLQARESEILHPCKHLQSTYIRLPKFKQLYSFNYLTVEAFFLSIQLEQSRTGSNIAYCDTLVEIVSNRSLYAWFISKTYFFTPKRCF